MRTRRPRTCTRRASPLCRHSKGYLRSARIWKAPRQVSGAARERVAAIPDDSGTVPTMTAARIGEQRTEVLSKRG